MSGGDAASVVSFNDALVAGAGGGTVRHPVDWGRGDKRAELAKQHALRQRKKAYEAKVWFGYRFCVCVSQCVAVCTV